ncbi:MAG: hypothetical protein ACUVUC_15075 [Thermoguttaceae bacterium]
MVVCCVGLVQLAGLLSAAILRRSSGASQSRTWRGAFVACLGLAGLGPVIGLRAAGYWLAYGITLSLMLLTAICQSGRPRHPIAL